MAISSTHAGHGGAGKWTDPGAVGNGLQEATVARTINSKIVNATGARDVTDNKGTNANAILANTVGGINASPDGWHISNHLNAFSDPKANGVEVLYGSLADKPMAEKVSKAISDATGLFNRGAKDGTWLYIARNSGANKKVLLIEWGFITNKSDMDKLQKNMDKGITAMLKCFGYNVTVVPTPAKATTQAKQEIINRTKTDSRVGKVVSVATTATSYATGQKINQSVTKGKKYKVIEKGVRKSDKKNAYLLDGIVGWVLEQDIPEFKVTSTPAPAPKPEPVVTKDTIYSVMPNDTLWAISRKYGTTVEQLKSWNNLKSDILVAGQKIIVKKGTTSGFNINNYHTTKPARIKMVKDDWAYTEKELKNKKVKTPKNTIYTVDEIVYSGEYPRYKLKSGLYVTTLKDTVAPV